MMLKPRGVPVRPRIRWGSWVRLNSGSYPMLVVDIDSDHGKCVVAWRDADGVTEERIPCACLTPLTR